MAAPLNFLGGLLINRRSWFGRRDFTGLAHGRALLCCGICSECPELQAEALHLAARLRLAYRTTPESGSRWQTITQRCKNWRVHTILQRVIQKFIIPADQRRPKSLQMTGFEYGPSVARRVSAAVESAGRCILTSPRAEPHGGGIGASTWSEPWDRQP
jgi:hypothetical protein